MGLNRSLDEFLTIVLYSEIVGATFGIKAIF
jgi:hypothetical protein